MGEEKPSDEDEPTINLSDPVFWRGATWIGPVIMRRKKVVGTWGSAWKSMRGSVNSGTATVVIPTIPTPTMFSRDGVNWSNSFIETFSDAEVGQMEEQEDQERHEEFVAELERIRMRDARASLQYYLETGEEDAFAWAERRAREYEIYSAKMDMNVIDADRVGNVDYDDVECDDY